MQDTISDLYVALETLTRKHLGQSVKTPIKPKTQIQTQPSEQVDSSIHSTPSARRDNSSLKLPHLPLKTFNGSTEQWISYISLFQVAVHENENISKVKRFQYLQFFNLFKNVPITA